MSSISPTAHYTGYVWARNGLSHPELQTREGQVLFESLRPLIAANRLLGGGSLERYLLTRHRALDVLLENAIENDGVRQVIEVACGMSPRGWRFSSRYGDELVYVEADLPDMAERKRAALERAGALSDTHRVSAVDALREEGPGSLGALREELDPGAGLAIITEGLLGYLPRDAVEGIWARFASLLSGFSVGRYFSDLHIGNMQTPQVRFFRLLLAGFVRGRVYLHFEHPSEAVKLLQELGFAGASVHPAARLAPEVRGPGSGLAHVVVATV